MGGGREGEGGRRGRREKGDRREGRGRERNNNVREKHRLVDSCMCPD